MMRVYQEWRALLLGGNGEKRMSGGGGAWHEERG